MSVGLLLAASVAASELTICADRPSKANGTCTVPAGYWQLEASAVDWARSKDGDGRTDVTSIGSTMVKYGLTDESDLELGFSPYVHIRSRDADARERASGLGDTVLRYKRRLTSRDSPLQLGLIPFVKLPTAARRIGNGKLEGGIAVPANLTTKAGVTITVGPELDVLSDSDGHGYHVGITNLVNLSVGPTPQLSLAAELWNNINFDPAGTIRQWSLDASAAYLPSKRVQLDAGANLGLNRNSPDIQLYAGASILF